MLLFEKTRLTFEAVSVNGGTYESPPDIRQMTIESAIHSELSQDVVNLAVTDDSSVPK